jgi:uncharacterized membrane protein HdeD (DUF308 family)
MPNEIYILISVLFIGFGVWVLARPKKVSSALEKLYGSYPLIGRLNQEQHKSRKPFAVALGITFIVLGVVALTMRP